MAIFCMGKIKKKPVVIDNEIVIRPMMTLYITFDHRYGDAALMTRILNILKEYFEDPENFDTN